MTNKHVLGRRSDIYDLEFLRVILPFLEGLLRSGMGNGPALALLLAGPALSLPNMLVIRSVLGTRKTATYVLLVVVLSTFAGLIYGNLIMNGVQR